MFIALVIKEWREKALIFLFELAVLAGLLGAQYLVRENRDLREWFVYAVLLLFFPFAALILGTAGFESEYRQGAWTYLFSRPVSRITVWGAKFAALLSLVTALWLVFVTAWAALPAIREMAAGPRVFLDELAANGFPWWSLGLSLFMFIVAFSLSFLHERYFNLLFVALALGLALPAAAWFLYVVRDGRLLAWISTEKAFRTLLVGLALMAAALIGASLRTLVRADFAQPRKRIWAFAGWFIPLLLAGQTLTVATALWLPMPGEKSLYFMASARDSAFYETERGLFAYNVSSGKIRWVEKTRHNSYFLRSTSKDRFAYVSYEYVARNSVREEIWVCDPDGTGRQRILGRDTPAPWPKDPGIRQLKFSPDGRRLAVLTEESRRLAKNRIVDIYGLWTVNADGSGLERLPLDPILMDGATEASDLFLMAWGHEANVLVFTKRYRYRDKPAFQSLWLYDLSRRTAIKVDDDAGMASWWTPISPRGDLFAIRYPYGDPKVPRTLALLDLKTHQKIDIAQGTDGAIYGFQWDPTGEFLFYILKMPREGGRSSYVMAVYSLRERKVVSEKIIASAEHSALRFSAAWMPDGRSLIAADEESRYFALLGLDLEETGRFNMPNWLTEFWGIVVFGRQVLIVDSRTHSLWRLDLDTKRWKRIY